MANRLDGWIGGIRTRDFEFLAPVLRKLMLAKRRALRLSRSFVFSFPLVFSLLLLSRASFGDMVRRLMMAMAMARSYGVVVSERYFGRKSNQP